MSGARIPEAVLAWAMGSVVPRGAAIERIDDVSWPRASSRVWRFVRGGAPRGEAETFLKLSPGIRSFHAELNGFAAAARAIGGEGEGAAVPSLIAADEGLLAIASTGVAGTVVRTAALGRADELAAHRAAGRALRRWHDASPRPTPRERAAARAAMRSHAEEAELLAVRLAGELDGDRLGLVASAAREIPSLTEEVGVVFGHGDYSPRNWLWDARAGWLGVIDFGLARFLPAVEETVWLHGAVWTVDAELRRAFADGYGRAWSASETRLLALSTARLAASYLATGLDAGRTDLVDRGRLALDRVLGALDPGEGRPPA